MEEKGVEIMNPKDKQLKFQEDSLIEINPDILDLNKILKCELSDEPPVAEGIRETVVQVEATLDSHTVWVKTEPQDDWDRAEQETDINESSAPHVFKTEVEAPQFVVPSDVAGPSTSNRLEELDPSADLCTQKTELLCVELPQAEDIMDPAIADVPGDLKIMNHQLLIGRPCHSKPSDAGTLQVLPAFEKSAQGNNSSITLHDGNSHCEGTTSSDPGQEELDCNIYCEECQSSFTNKANHSFPLHMHTPGHTSKCAGCLKMFTNKKEITKQLDMHVNNRLYSCSQCHKTFSCKRYLNIHLKRHSHVRSFMCFQCNKGFTEKSNLSRHMLSHSGERRHQCSECDKSFTHSSTLRSHMTVHTGERPHQCSQCDRSFAQKSHLTNHIRLHSGDRPFHCPQCDKRFTVKSNLNRHIISHTGEQRYPCSECNKCFSQKTLLNIHLRVHSGDRPFHCSQCDKSFSVKSNLNRHIRLHNDDHGQ